MTILVAEIGWNFVGDLSLAKKMILKAKKAGADAVKFQIWDPEQLKKGSWDLDGRRKIYEKAFLDKNKYSKIKKFAKKNSIKCFASAFNDTGLRLLEDVKDDWIKIPSHEAYNTQLIKLALKKFKKVIISAGCLKKKELLRLIKLVKSKKDYSKKTILLHCVSSYPLKAENCNFKKFDFLMKNFHNVGYSGHYQGVEDSVYALSKGAILIEKHFTINNNLPGRDNKFALNFDQFSTLFRYKKLFTNFNIAKGIDLQKCEIDIFKNYRGRWSRN